MSRTIDPAIKNKAIETLNTIMELELAGVVRYTHYSLMVYGYGRIPIVSWMKSNADESLAHASKAGELVTLLGGHPSLRIGPLLETHQHDIGDILRESLAHEKASLEVYYELLRLSEGKSVLLPARGPVGHTVREILGGLRSTCTYVGARKLKDLSKCTTFVRVGQQLNTVFGEI